MAVRWVGNGLATIAAAALSLGACTPQTRDDRPIDPAGGESSNPSTDGGAGPDAPTDDTTSAGDGDTSDVRLDVEHGTAEQGTAESGACDPEVDEECGCTAVDLLFVVDNSGSMGRYQEVLGEAFPAFAQAIIDALPRRTSLHVGVTSTEMGRSSSGTTSGCSSNGDDGQPTSAFYVTPDVQDTGINGAQGRLYETDGRPYYDIVTTAPAAEVAFMEQWFADAVAIGEGGSNIEMAAGPVGWLGDPATADVNRGFLRDEGAVLVLFFIQDEPDQTPPDEIPDILDRLARAKQGCGGLDCVIGGGFVNEMCLPQVPLGTVLASLGAPAVTGTLPPSQVVQPSDFMPLLRDTLATVIAEKCEEIPPPVG